MRLIEQNLPAGLKVAEQRILKLKPEYEVPFILFLEGLSFGEVAVKLGLPVQEVKEKIFTARRILTK